MMKPNRIIAAMLSCAAIACEAVTLTGPGDAVISSAEPMSLAGETVRLGGNVQAFYEGCLATTNRIVFKNVQLSDIQSTSVLLGSSYHTGKKGRWLTAETYFRKENSDGTLELEMQAKGSSALMGCVVRFSQNGDDVAAQITLSKYQNGYDPGAITLRNYGGAMTVVEDELLTGSSSPRYAVWKNLTAVLTSSPAQVPRRIVFDNVCTETTNCPMSSVAEDPFTNTTSTLIWKDTDLSSVTSFSAKLGGGKVGNSWRTALPCNIEHNGDGTVQARFNYGTNPLISVLMLFEQRDNDVFAKIKDARYVFGVSDPAYNFDDSAHGGALLEVIVEEKSSVENTVSIKEIGCEWTRPSIWDEVLVNEGLASTNWQALVENADMEDVANVAATMSGSIVGNVDRNAHIVNVTTNTDGAVDSQYQFIVEGSKLIGVALRYEQFGPDIRYRVWKSAYQWSQPIGYNVSSMGGAAALVEPDGGSGVVSLRNMKFMRTRKVLLPVALGDFDCRDRPIKLSNVELQVASGAGGATVFSSLVYGTGKIVVHGAAKIASGADFKVPLAVTSQGELQIGMARDGTISPLSVKSFSSEDGATIVLRADAPLTVSGPLSCPLVSGEAADAVGNMNVRLEGSLSGRYKAAVVSGSDGALSVSLKPIKGLVVVFQ